MREADTLLDQKQYLRAQAQYETVLPAMEKKPKRFSTWIPVVHNALGVAAYQAKNYPKALDYFQRSLSKAQRAGDKRAEADILENIGETHFHAGDLTKAEERYKRITGLTAGRIGFGDRYAKAFYWLGKIYDEKDWKGKAIESYERFIELWKDCDPEFP